MEEDNLYEYEGVSYSESALREAYPDTFDEYVNQGILTKVEGESPTAVEDAQEESFYEYEGESYAESALRDAYPDTFDEYVNQGILTKVDGLGKQIAVEDSATETAMDLVSEDGLSESQEKDTWVERTFGKNTITDFLGDLYRAGEQGFLQAEGVDPSIDIMTAGADASAIDVYKYVQKNKEIASKSMESDEMKDFNRVYDENGGGAFGFLMGVIESPSVLPSLFVSSMATQIGSLQSEEVTASAAAGAGSGALLGLAGGVFTPLTSAAGAMMGGFGAGAAAMEAGLTFSELLQEEIDGELTAEKVRAVLNDPEKLSDLRMKAVGRGVAVGAVEGLSAGLAGKASKAVAGAIPKGKSIAGRAVRKASVPLTGGAVEVVGGMTGEVAGRLAADQEMDVKEIGFEGFAGLGSAPASVLPTTIKNINIVSGRANAAKVAKKGGYSNVSSVFDPNTDIDETTMELAVNKSTSNIVDEQVEIEVANGRMSEEDADAIKQNFRDTQGAVNTANKIDRLSKESKPEAVRLLIEEEKLKNKIKDVDNASLTKTESIRLEQVKARLEEISNPKEETVSEETEIEEETGVPLTPEEPVSVETAPVEDTIPQEDLEELETEIQSREGQGSILDNAKKEEKVYLNGKEGNIKIDPTNENTIIFESSDEIIELGNKDEVGSEPIAGFGLTKMPPEGLEVQPEGVVEDVVSVDGKQYKVIGRSRDKKGKAVVKLKEVGTGLQRRFKGPKAERVLKDIQLRKDKKGTPLPLTVEGKEVAASEATTPTKEERRAKKVAEKKKTREEYDKKSLDELSKMEEEHQRAVQEFEEMALEEAANESKDKDLVQVGESVFQVTKNADGSFSVSQMNESGKLIGTREEAKRSKAIGVFKSKKSNQERRALAKAEKLIDEFKKEELQKIDNAIDEKLSARQQKSEDSKPAFNERIDAPESVVINALKVLRNSYAAGMTIMQSVDDALSFMEDQGFSANEFYFKKFVLDTLKTPKPKETTKATPKTKTAPTKKLTAKERVFANFGKGRIRKQAENARKALSKIAKGVTIEVYDTQEEFEAATNGDSVSGGIYDPSTKTIKINLERANPRTVAHEVFHALLLKDGITNQRAQKITSDMLSAVRKVASPKLLKQLDAFAGQYINELQSEESIAELFGILAENYESSPQSVKDLINDWLRKLAKILNVPVEGILGSDKQVLEFLDVVSGKVARGEVIEQSDIEVIQDVDNGVPIENAYINTNGGIVIDTGSERRQQLDGSVINESDIIETSSLNGKPLEIVYYDNFTSSPYTLTNRVSESSLNKVGEGGPGYSYRKEIKDAGIVAAFTTVTKGLNLIQGISSRNKIAGDDAVIGVTLQNKETGHLGNKTTARDFYSPNPSEGVIALAVSDNVISEKEAVKILKDAVDAYSNTSKGKDSRSSLPFNSSDFNSISEFYDRILNTSFERRGTFNSNAIPKKSDLKITKSTRPYLKKWIDSGITTLLDYYESTQEPYTREAMPHDIVKYISPNLKRVGVDPSVEVTNAERDRAKSMGVEIETIDESLTHTSYPVVIFGENVGIPSRFISVREISKDWDAPNPFFKAGRRPDTAEPVLIRQQKVFRAGDLVNKAEEIGKFKSTIRGTGHFGTGFYFFGNREDAESYAQITGDKGSSRIVSDVDLDDYNLAKATLGLHLALKNVNDKAMSSETPEITSIDLSLIAGKTNSKLLDKQENPYKKFGTRNQNERNELLKEYTEEEVSRGESNYFNFEFRQNDIQDEEKNKIVKDINNKLKSESNKDTPSTLIMKALGFEGVDATGTELDNPTYGTVVYDIKPQTRQQRTTRLAPNGKQSNLTDIQYDTVRTPAFKNWFGDWENNPKNASKVVDENGEPLVVYHGTPSVDINIFDREKSKRRDSGLKEFGTYFATNKNLAELYKQGDGRIYPIFLNIRDMVTFDANKETNIEAWNNLTVKASYKIATNRDAMEFLSPVVSKKKDLGRFGVEPVNGIKAENIIDMSVGTEDKKSEAYKKAEKEYLGDVYLLFDGQPENAKLADGTNTTFDPDAPSIRQQKAQDDFTIQDVIENAEQENLTRKETIEVLQELGFTKDEIRGAMKPVKKKARSVESETTGLSPREAFKQGFTEFFDAIQRGKKEARQKAADNLKEKVNKLRESFKKRLQKEKDNKAARAAVVKEIRAIIKESGLSQFSKRTINKIMTNVKNTNANNMQRMVDEVMDVVNRDIDRRVRAARIKTLKVAVKKLSRLGALKELQKPLMEVLSIDPSYLSKAALNFYDKVVVNLANVEKKFDNRASREEIKNAAEEVIKKFTADNIKAEELAEKTINPNLDLTKTKGENLKQMLKDGLISDSDFELMTRFKDLIGNTSKEGLTLEELEQKAKERRDAAIEDFEAAMEEIPSSLPNLSRDDAEALRFANGLKMKDLESLSTTQINILTRGLEMLQAGFVTTNLIQSKVFVEAKREVTTTLTNETVERGKLDKAISSAKVYVQNIFRKRDKMITSIENRIKSTPLANIDQILNAGAKKFKSTKIYESIFRPAGIAFASAEKFLEDTKKKLQLADSYLDLNRNKRYVQKAKVMIYQIQREFESNKENKETNEAIKWIEATLNDPESNISDVERKAIEKVRDEFTVNGQIDSKKILDSLTSKEKKYMSIVDEVYKSVEFMVAADAKMQGKTFIFRDNYVHLPKVTKSKNSMSSELDEIANSFTNPALKNKALTQRTGKTHAISFDPTFNVNGIAKKAAISYYMYPVVKKAKIILAGIKENADTKFQKETADALENVFDGIVKSQYSNLSRERAFIEKALSYLGRAGYLAQLAGPVKAMVELTTNVTHALFVNPSGLISGFDTLRSVDRSVINQAFEYINTTQKSRLTGSGIRDSKETEGRLTNDSLNLFEQEEMTSELRAKVSTLFKFAKKPIDAIVKFNENLISRPDTIVATPLFVGVFNTSFENIANEKPNWDKIANDQAYRDKFKDAIDQATEDADAAVVDNTASNNPFDGIPKNILDKDATAVKQALQMVDRYMSRFRTFEYYSALKAIQGLMGTGKLTPTQGAMLLTGTVVRLSLYKMGIDMVFSLIFSMMGIDEEEDKIDFEKDLTKGVLGAVATLALGRNIGNISQMPINFGTEWLNKEYGEDITREGEYNTYKDGIVFSKIPLEVKPQDNMTEKILASSLGSYTPMAKTLQRAGKLATRTATSKRQETIDRNFGELTTRIPFEIAGNLGVIPGYKTLRKIYLKYLFGEANKK